jgi:hypothetical protein
MREDGQHGNLETEENEKNRAKGKITPVKTGRNIIDVTMECREMQ